jgi:hypothetical protein
MTRFRSSPKGHLLFPIAISIGAAFFATQLATPAQTNCGSDCEAIRQILKERTNEFRGLMTGKSFGENKWETRTIFIHSDDCAIYAVPADSTGKASEWFGCTFANTDAAASQRVFEELVAELKRNLPPNANIFVDSKEQFLVRDPTTGSMIVRLDHVTPDYSSLSFQSVPHAADAKLIGQPNDFVSYVIKVLSNRTWVPQGHEKNGFGYAVEVAVELYYNEPHTRFYLTCYHTNAMGARDDCQQLQVGGEFLVTGLKDGTGLFWVDGGTVGGKGERRRFYYTKADKPAEK